MDDLKEYIKDAIKILVVICLSSFAFCLCSCGTKSKVVETSYVKDSTFSYVLNHVDKVTANGQQGTYTKIVFYDTSLPVDKETGKPPEKVVIEKRDSIFVLVEKVDTIYVVTNDSIYEQNNMEKASVFCPNIYDFVIMFAIFGFIIVVFAIIKRK